MEGSFMLHTTRRLLAGPLLIAAVAAGLVAVPGAADAAGISATVDVRSTLLVRSAPSLAAAEVGRLYDNDQVSVECSVAGTKVRGSVRTSDQWDRIGTGKYVSYAYLSSVKPIPVCETTSPQAEAVKTKAKTKAKAKTPARPAYVIGTVKSTDGIVNIRAAATSSAVKMGTIKNLGKVWLSCGVVGDKVAGTVRTTTQWDRMVNGTYISHAYVVTPTLHLCPGASLRPESSASLTPEQFIAAAVPGAQAGWREFGVPASVTLAQAILESGWGRSGLSTVDNNYFGIKCFNGQYGSIANGCHAYNTNECTKAGTCFSTTATFRTYSSPTNSFRDHGNFLKVNSRYAPAFAYTRDANKFIWNVWKAGYATDPNYYTKVTGIMAANGLYQYDVWK
jgi:flagellum-specific peptidoglycan hydrolase FlgJ